MSYQYQTWTFSNDTQPKYVINREQRCYNVFQPPHVVSWNAAKRCHLRHYRGLCPSSCDPSAAGETLQQACHQAHWHQSVLHVAVWHNTAGSGIMAWWQEQLNSCGSISSHYTHTSSLQLTVGWCWQRDPGLHLKHISSQCGGGDTRAIHWWTVKEASRRAVWDAEAIMCFLLSVLWIRIWFESMWLNKCLIFLDYVLMRLSVFYVADFILQIMKKKSASKNPFLSVVGC